MVMPTKTTTTIESTAIRRLRKFLPAHRNSAADRSAMPRPAIYTRCSSTTSASGINAYAVSGDNKIAANPAGGNDSVLAGLRMNQLRAARTRIDITNSGLYQWATATVCGSAFRADGYRKQIGRASCRE